MSDQEPPTSGLRNPTAASRGVGAAVLVLEAIVLLLAIQPIRTIAPDTSGWGIGAVALLALGCFVVPGLMRKPWGWHAGTVLQVLVLAAGFINIALLIVGLIFGAIWLYALHVRKVVSKPAHFDH